MRKRMALENFIKENRADFDDLKAPERIWDRISPGVPKVTVIWKWTALAASALLLLAIGFIMGNKIKQNSDIAGWDEYQETEQYYESRIQEKMDQIRSLQVSEEVMADIKVLDDVYHDLRTQLLEDPNADSQMLLSTMIRHQQQKLEVMEEILTRVDKYPTTESKNHEM